MSAQRPYAPASPLAEEALARLAARLVQPDLPTPELVSVAGLILQDSWFCQRLAFDEQKRLDQKERAADLKDYRSRSMRHKYRCYRLAKSRHQLSKKTLKQRVAKAHAPKPEQQPQDWPKLVLTPVSPSPEQELERIKAGIPRGGVDRIGPSRHYYDDKPELLAQLEKEDRELEVIKKLNKDIEVMKKKLINSTHGKSILMWPGDEGYDDPSPFIRPQQTDDNDQSDDDQPDDNQRDNQPNPEPPHRPSPPSQPTALCAVGPTATSDPATPGPTDTANFIAHGLGHGHPPHASLPQTPQPPDPPDPPEPQPESPRTYLDRHEKERHAAFQKILDAQKRSAYEEQLRRRLYW